MNNLEQFLYRYDYIKTADIFSKKESAVIFSGSSCNLSCKYCFLDGCKENPEYIKFESEKLEEALKPSLTKKDERVSVWLGEPLYNKELFVNVCELINRVLPNHIISIYTNGTLINDWWADFFKDHKVYIKLSHDGPGQKYRGIDYLKSESHIRAIKKIYDNGNLSGLSTTIHKYNCSFNDIINYFAEFENRTGIVLNSQDRTLVKLTLSNDSPYDFDYMDKQLIQYMADTYRFLFKKILAGDLENTKVYFPPETNNDISGPLKYMLGLPYKSLSNPECYKSGICVNGKAGCLFSPYKKDLPYLCYTSQRPIKVPCTKCFLNDIYSISCIKLCNGGCKKIIDRFQTICEAIKLMANEFNISLNEESLLNNIEGNYEALYTNR
jgi:organic radical activating enzyme